MNLFMQLSDLGRPLLDRFFEVASDIDVYCELMELDMIEPGVPVYSPLRLDDNDPSFSLFVPTRVENLREDELWWRDFKGTGGDVFKFTKQFAALHYGEELNNIYDIIQFLDKTMGLGLFTKSEKEFHRRKLDYAKARQPKTIYYKEREFTLYDKVWWIDRCIDIPLLQESRTHSVKYLLDDFFEVKHSFKETDLAYAMHVLDALKLYCPESKDFKWRSTCTSNHVFGSEQWKGHEAVIITKSNKDIMTFKSFMNVDSIALQGEGNIFPQELVDFLKSKHKYIVAVMDYDPAGIEAAERIKELGIPTTFIDTKQEVINGKLTVWDKDASDYALHHGPHETLEHFKKLFSDFPPHLFREDRPDIIYKQQLELRKQLEEYEKKYSVKELSSILY